MQSFLIELGSWFRPYQYQTAMAIIATVLVIFGNDINSAIKKLVSKQHVFVRVVIFVLVCAVGYGLLTVWLTQILAQQLSYISNLYIAPCIFFIFLVLGAYAQRQRHI
ncbi:MAG: DUF3392 domain-containing protein [Colwellia sp.]|nr:DUF3392 domain-containing protein [Colwellia sp.]